MKSIIFSIIFSLSTFISFQTCFSAVAVFDCEMKEEEVQRQEVDDEKGLSRDIDNMDSALSRWNESADIYKKFWHGVSYLADPRVLFAKIFIAFKGNFYEVVKGKLYRSDQLSCQNLQSYIQAHKNHYQTDIIVVNLRGRDPHAEWWNNEKKVVEDEKSQFVDIAMNADIFTSPANIKHVLKIYDEAIRENKALYCHCKAGADRTGEFIALILYLMGRSREEVLSALIWHYGHNAFMFPKKIKFITALLENKSVDDGRKWLEEAYDPTLF